MPPPVLQEIILTVDPAGSPAFKTTLVPLDAVNSASSNLDPL